MNLTAICENTDEERDAAKQAVQQQFAAMPSDREVVAAFLKDCRALDTGLPLALDENGFIVTLDS